MRCSGVSHFLTMFVHAGDERHIVTIHALVARHGIGRNGRICRAQMRRCVHIIDGRREAVGTLRH